MVGLYANPLPGRATTPQHGGRRRVVSQTGRTEQSPASIARVTPPVLTLRDVRASDVDAYVRMRCDPAMMSELGGPQPRSAVVEKVERDVRTAMSGEDWILMIIPIGSDDVAGSVVVWTNTERGEPYSEIGWTVLPEYQGRGLAKTAVRTVLNRARQEGRWGVLHAFPSVMNGPSNGICRALGFSLLGEETIEFAGKQFRSNHWCVDPEGC